MRSQLSSAFFLCLGMIVNSPGASASVFDGICTTYRSSDPMPPEAAEILVMDKQGAVTVCTSRTGIVSYSLASSIYRGKLGTCQYRQRAVFGRLYDNRRRWSFTPSSEEELQEFENSFVSLQREGECPPQSVDSYVQISNVSEDAFVKFMRAWKKMKSSTKLFRRAVGSLSQQQIGSRALDILNSWFLGSPQSSARIYYIGRLPHASHYSISAISGDESLEIKASLVHGEFRIFDVGEPSI